MRRLLISLLVLLALTNSASVRAASCPQGVSVPVIAWLTPRIDVASSTHFWWRPGEDRNGPYLPIVRPLPNVWSLLALRGAAVSWLGYDSAAPFGGFTYPAGGTWFERFDVRMNGASYQVWVWNSFDYTQRNVLVFTFVDMNVTGTPAGQHNFCAFSVSKAALNRVDPDGYLMWRQ